MIVTEAETLHQLAADFLQTELASSPSWLCQQRQQAWQRFSLAGIPTTKEEDWRFTKISSYLDRPYQLGSFDAATLAGVAALIPRATLDEEFHRLVFVNGLFAPQWSQVHSLPQGVVIENIATAIRERPQESEQRFSLRSDLEEPAFVSLNTAIAQDGAFIHIPDGVSLERPIHLIFLASSEGAMSCHPRSVIALGRGSRATVIESFFGGDAGDYFTNAHCDIRLSESADLDHHKLQHEHQGALHLATTDVHQESASRFRSHYFSFGSALSRNELNCFLAGEQIHTTLNGLYMPSGDQLMDCRTRIDHAKPNCNSYELYKGILDDRSRGVFNGKIFVHQDAQKTDAKQSNQAILLSDDAVIDTKPQLEIYADDVRCTHGATIGELDEQGLYYLQSRGIPKDLARTMLIFAFANDVVQGVEVPAVQTHLESLLLSDRGLPEV